MFAILREVGREATVRWLLKKPLQDHPRRRRAVGGFLPDGRETPCKRRIPATSRAVETQLGKPPLRKRAS